jgi:hypothetical protein
MQDFPDSCKCDAVKIVEVARKHGEINAWANQTPELEATRHCDTIATLCTRIAARNLYIVEVSVLQWRLADFQPKVLSS